MLEGVIVTVNCGVPLGGETVSVPVGEGLRAVVAAVSFTVPVVPAPPLV
jgi:hypothetical protein